MSYRWLMLACLWLLGMASSVSAWDCCTNLGITESRFVSYLGFREDSLRWKVKAKRNNPLVVAEVCFDDVKMIEKGLSSEITLCDRWAIKADGNIAIGYNKARDWAFDLSVALGYHFNLCNCSMRLTPLVGYAIDQERYHLCDRDFLSDIETETTYDFTVSQLTSFYRAHWYSPFIGFDFHYAINECWKFYSDFAYHFVTLKGKGHTTVGNFQQNSFMAKDCFHQNSHGWGFTWDCGIQYAIDCNWLLDVGTQFEYRKAHHGHQHSHHSFKERIAVDDTVLKANDSHESKNHVKHVDWRSLRIEVGLAYRF